MGWRFRKRINIASGVNLNLSKSGVSTTIGRKGASVNIGKNGAYLNTGIPGTGLYNRTKLKGVEANSRKTYSSKYTKGSKKPLTQSLFPSKMEGSFWEYLVIMCKCLCSLALPFYITMHHFKFDSMNQKFLLICSACLAIFILSEYLFIINRKKRNEIDWLAPLDIPILLWAIVCGLLIAMPLILHLLSFKTLDSTLMFRDLLSIIIAITYLVIRSKVIKRRKINKKIEVLPKLVNESSGTKQLFYYGELLSYGIGIDDFKLPKGTDIVQDLDSFKRNDATLVIDYDLGIDVELFNRLSLSHFDITNDWLWELHSYYILRSGYLRCSNNSDRTLLSFSDDNIFNHVASSKVSVISFGTSKKANFIYPRFWIAAEDYSNFTITSIQDVDMSIKKVLFIEDDKKLLFTNKRIDTALGSPVYQYGLVTISPFNYKLLFSRFNSAQLWVNGFYDYKRAIKCF